MREVLPNKRRHWTQRVRIGGQTLYLCVGEYPDGRPGEVFLDIAKQGTLLRGVMNSLARVVSLALQCGCGVEQVVSTLKGMDYPPDGPVEGSVVGECKSLTDWVAKELSAHYLEERVPDGDVVEGDERTPEGDVLEKVAGYKSESWRSGV